MHTRIYVLACMCISYLWKDTSEADNIGYLWGEELGERQTSVNTFLSLLNLELGRMYYLFKNMLKFK